MSSLKDVYNALKGDSQFSQTKDYATFAKRMNERGYSQQIYLNLKNAGATLPDIATFRKRLGLHVWTEAESNAQKKRNAAARKSTSQPSSPATRAAQEVAQQNWGGVEYPEYMNDSTAQSGVPDSIAAPVQNKAPQQQAVAPTPKSAPQVQESELVRALRGKEKSPYLQRPIDYTSKNALKEMIGEQRRRQNETGERVENAGKTVGELAKGKWFESQLPAFDVGSSKANDYIVKTQGQLEKEMSDSAGQMADKDFGSVLADMVTEEFKNASGRAAEQSQLARYGASNPVASDLMSAFAGNLQKDPALLQKNLGKALSDRMDTLISQPGVVEKIKEESRRLGVTPEDYIKNGLIPKMNDRLMQEFDRQQLDKYLPKGNFEYIIDGIGDSMVGSLFNAVTMTRGQREYKNRALAETEAGNNRYYKPDAVAGAMRGGVGLLSDAPVMGGLGKAAGWATSKIFGNSVKAAANMANMSRLQRVFNPTVWGRGAVETGLNFGLYEGAKGTQDYVLNEENPTWGGALKAGASGFGHGAASGATFGIIGKMLGGLGYNVGLKGTEKGWWQNTKAYTKGLGMRGIEVVGEGEAFMLGGNINALLSGKYDEVDWSTDNQLKNVVQAGVYKLMSVHTAEKIMHPIQSLKGLGVAHSVGDRKYVFTDDELHELATGTDASEIRSYLLGVSSDYPKNKKRWRLTRSSTGENVEVSTREVYETIMNNPRISWDAKAKFSALMTGVVPEHRPEMDYHTFTFERLGGETEGYKYYVNEYAADGTLLSKRSYDTADKREAIVYELGVNKENARVKQSINGLIMRDCSRLDLQTEFLKQHGYDFENPDSEANRRLIAEMQGTPQQGLKLSPNERTLRDEWLNFVANNGQTTMAIIEFAKNKGYSVEDFFDLVYKTEPLKRTEEEQKMLVEFRKHLDSINYGKHELTPGHSEKEGRDIVEENNLGSEQPNGDAVKQVMQELSKAEDELQAAMDGNDVFKEEYDKLQAQGLSNTQIYNALVQSGLTPDQLAPLAHYINANAKVQGMVDGTQKRIEENVQKRLLDWGYKGRLNDTDVKGQSVVFVTDKNGRLLIVGAGDISFDPQGRAREDVGDMITVLDPQTNEMDFISVKDVKLDHVETAEDYGNKYRQYLQELNSKAYAEAQAEQAQQEGNNPPKAGNNPPSETSILPITNDGKGGMDKNGNILNSDGSIYTEKVGKIEEISEEDFNEPTRSVELPLLPKNVADALGSEGKPVIIKKSIFEKNLTNHPELEPEDSRAILAEALYNPNLVGQTQPSRRPSYKVAVKTGDKNSVVVLDVYNDKKQIEIVGWRRINEKGLAKMQRQAEREGGQFLILSPKNGSAAALSTLPHGLSSVPKDSNNSPNNGENKQTLTFSDGTPVPMTKDSKGRDTADYSKMTPEQGAEYLKMAYGENAEKAVDGKIKRAETAVKAADKMKVDYSGDDADAMEAEAKKKAAMEAAQKELAFFTMVKNLIKQAKAKEQAGGGGLTGNRYDQWRKDGYHIGEGGVRYDRQKKEDMTGVYGRDVKVDFSPTVSVNGRAKVVEVDSVQASHINGQVNPMHFGPDWQPKDRTDNASRDGQDKALKNFDADKITGDGNAFIGSSPSVNERHEVIQGNNRAEILRRLYDEQPEKAAAYKQWLIDHAAEFGYDPAEIAKMKRPVLVNELPVDDATAKALGQYRASDFESGGKEIPRTSVVINRLGEKMQNVASILLSQGSLPDDAKMSDLMAQNANKVLDFLVKEGVISATEEQTLRKDNTVLRQWMEELLKTGLFEGDRETEAAFGRLPDNARRAVLATYMRDAKSDDAAKIKQNLQRSFEAYVQMMNDPAFANAKNVADARAAVAAEIERGNESLFGEDPIREKFSNFELELAALYKGLKDQKTLTGLLNKYFDAVQGDRATGRQLEIGEEPRDAISKEEAIKEVFGLHDSKPAETQHQVDEAVKGLITEITKQVGDDFVETDDKTAQERIARAEGEQGEVDPVLKDAYEISSALSDRDKFSELVSKYLYPNYANFIFDSGAIFLADPVKAVRYFENNTVKDYKAGEKVVKPGMLDAWGKIVNAVSHREFGGADKPIERIANAEADGTVLRYSKREMPAPKKTKKVYKLMRLGDDGKLYPLFIDATAPTEIGVWYDADSPDLSMLKDLPSGVHLVDPKTKKVTSYDEFFNEHKDLFRNGKQGKYPSKEALIWATDHGMRFMYIEDTKNGQKRFGGEKRKYWNLGLNGTGSVSTFSLRPGWHAGSLPTMRQIGKGKNKDLRDDRFVWVEGEVSADKDYNAEAEQNPDKDLPDRIPEDGYYMKATNADKSKSQADRVGWYVAGSFKANRIIGDKEARKAIDDWNAEHPDKKVEYDYERESGKIFNAETMQLENSDKPSPKERVKEFRTKDGEVYGFTDGERVYLDTKKMKPETPLHEYTHLWSDALRRVNPKEWEHVKGLFDKVDGLKEEVKKLYPELEGDDLYDEMIAVFSGREGAKKVEDVVRRLAAEDGKSVTESAKAMGFIERVKTALKTYWKGVADLLHIHFTTAEEVADKVLADWAGGFDPRKAEERMKEREPEGERKPEGGESPEKPLSPEGELKPEKGESPEKQSKPEGEKTPEGKEKPQTPSDPVAGIKSAAEQYKEEQRKRNGQQKEQTPEEKAAARAKEMEENPLTEEEIDSYSTGDEEMDSFAREYAKDYLNGDKNPTTEFYYNQIYNDVRNRRQDGEGDSSPADPSHVDGGDNEPAGLGAGGGETGRMGGEPSGTNVPGELPGEKGGEDGTAVSDGEGGNKPVGGEASAVEGVSTGSERPRRGGNPRGAGATGENPGSAPKGKGSAGETKQDAKARAKQSGDAVKDILAKIKAKRAANRKKDAGTLNAYPGLTAAVIGELSKKMLPRDKEEMMLYGQLMKACAQHAYDVLRVYGEKIENWFKGMRDDMHEAIKDAYGDALTDEDIDNYIRSLWNTNYTIDGRRQTIEKWAAEIGREKLRAALSVSLEEKRKKQQEAEKVEVKVGDADNIAESLPFLLPEQQNDVLKAETQFFDPTHADDAHGNGRGILFTNGTGTGKTYTGLGIAKRFIKQGKGRVLIVTPSPAKVQDWSNDAKNLGITLTPLKGEAGKGATMQKGEGAVVTTFANFRQNRALMEDVFDLIIYDESHKLMENRQAQESATTIAHYRMTNKDFSYAMERIQLSHPLWRESEELDAERSKLLKGNNSVEEARMDPEVSDESIQRIEQIDARLQEIDKEKAKVMPELTKQANESVGKTKVVFLSATPFNLRENLEYAEGYLFKYNTPTRPANITENEWQAMRRDARNQFYRQWFPHGERIGKSGKVEPYVSDADKNDVEERKFADHLMELGVMSGRTIDNGYDYSRDFPTISITHADRFNTAVKELMGSKELKAAAEKVFNDYNTMSVVYETMKASACAERIKEHMAMGRKVVVFHRRVNDRKGLAQPPFANVLKQAALYADGLEKSGGDGKAEALKVRKAMADFQKQYADLLQWEQTLDYRMPRQQIASLLGDLHDYTPAEMMARNEAQERLIGPAFSGKGDPYKAGYEFAKTCFDLEDADVVEMYRPHEISDEEAEALGIQKPSKAQHKKELEAYNVIAKQVRKGIEDNIRERIASGELKIELDANGKKVRHVGMFAGADSVNAKLEDMKSFNNDDSGMDVMVVQEASGKEGISLHDTTGKHQRVMINLALPQSPIAFIQAEGRIYRIGQKSNAIFEYPLLGIDNEIALFAGRFNGRAATTENLALGNMARGLKDAITRGVMTKQGKVPLAGQGYGGREWDLRDDQRTTGYDGAVRDWREENKDEQTGTIDDMDTPQPIGFKLAEWAKTNEGETVLEPSAGNGNVSRYLPSNAKSLSIEPDPKKYNNLMLRIGGVERGSAEAAGRRTLTMNGKFEDLSAQSKFDTIIMNSPNGAEGEAAKKHLELAVAHLNDSGRIVAVLPETESMDKFVADLVDGNPALRVTGEVKLPACAFSVGGLSQKTRVITIDKLTREEMRKNWKEKQATDLSDITDIETLVKKMKDVKMPDRVLDPAAKSMRYANMLKTKIESIGVFKSGKSRWSGVAVSDKSVYINIPNKFYDALRSDFYKYERNGRQLSLPPIVMSGSRYETFKNLDVDVLAQYKASSEILKMSDAEIREKCFNWRLKDKDAPLYVDALKQYSEAMAKMIRGISGRTDDQLLRAFNGEDVDNPVQVKAGTQMSVGDYKALFEANNENEELGALFNRVYERAKDLGLKIDVFEDKNTGTSAYYSGENHISINAAHWNAKKMVNERGQVVPATKAVRAEVLCHELIHSVTSYANYWYDHAPGRLPEGLREAAKELDDIYNKIIGSKESYLIPSYAKENKNELVAEMANPAVREPLKKMGMWTRLVNAVKKFFMGEEKQVAVDAGFAKEEDFGQSTVYNELSKTLDKFLNNFDEKSYDAFVALCGGERHEKKYEIVDEDKENSDELFLSLQNKKGKEYYDTVTELARRVSEGKATFTSLPEEYESRGVISIPQAVGRIIASTWIRDGEGSRNRLQFGTNDGGMRSSQLGQEREESELAQIEEWAKRNGYWINEDDYLLKGYKQNLSGSESIVYFVDDKVVKFTTYETFNKKEGVGGLLERITLMNAIDPEAALKVIGYSRDKNGIFRVVLEQKKFAKTFDLEFDENDDFTPKGEKQYDDWYENDAPKIKRQFARRGIKYVIDDLDATYGDNVIIHDLGPTNIACDEKGKYHIIDGNARLVAEDQGGEWGIRDIDTQNSDTHYRTSEQNTPVTDTIANVGKVVERISKKLGVKVHAVSHISEITDPQVRRDIMRGKKVQGWYDEKTGEVHLYLPNIHDSYTAEKTVWHETVGHKGMRGLLGDKFGDYMRSLWMDMDNPVNAELREYVRGRMAKEPMSMYDAIEEFIADAAEKGKGEPGFWLNVRNKVVNALHEIGYRLNPNVKDVKYMLWLAKNVQKHPNDAVWKMRADAVKWKIAHEKAEYTKLHGGEYYAADGKPHDFEEMGKTEWDEATDGQVHYRTAPSAATALDRYHRMLNSKGYMERESLMDNMLSVDKLMRALDPTIKKIEDVKSSMNPYMLQNTMQGRMSEKMQRFEDDLMKPLDQMMGRMLDAVDGKDTEEKTRNFNLYMIKKHGLERNRVFFVRDKVRKEAKKDQDVADKMWSEFTNKKEALGNSLRSGSIRLDEYYKELDEWIRANVDDKYQPGEHDYSGMHGMYGIVSKKSPYDDKAVLDEVMSTEANMEGMSSGSVKDFWSMVHAATKFSLYEDYANGFQTQQTFKRVAGMFDWYVPMRKFDETTAEDVYGYVAENNGKDNFIGSVLMAAKGRKSLSNVNVLAQIGSMGNWAIARGGQNLVKQAFMRYVREKGGQGLVTETKVWLEKKGVDANGNDIWEEVYPQIPEGASADTVNNIVEQFEKDMEAEVATGDAKNVTDRGDIGFRFERAADRSQHFVDVRVAGKIHRFVVNGNPRAAQALNGLLENGGATSKVGKTLKALTRWMAQMATSYNPEFMMRNTIRDFEFASSHIDAKEGAAYAARWMKYYTMNFGKGAKEISWKDISGSTGTGLYAKYRKGTLDVSNKTERWFKEFMENGGETGWVQMKNLETWEKQYKRDILNERSVTRKTVRTVKDFFIGNIENLNEVAENMARFATYCASRETGRSIVRSAYDAKEVSTNFNRHGSGDAITTFLTNDMGFFKKARRDTLGFVSSYFRNYSMFFNAGIQSTNLLIKNFKNAPIGTMVSMTASPFMLGALAALVNNMLINNEDEKKRGGVKDPYGELPDYIRRNNLCIYLGEGKFFTVPLAIELRAFYGLGDLAAGTTVAPNVKSQRNMAMDAVGCMSQLFPVIDFLNDPHSSSSWGEGALTVGKGIAPTAASPFIEWYANSDWKGAQIRRTGEWTENNPAWKNAYSGTPARLIALNRWVNATTNDVAPGNPDMKGNSALDAATDPSMINHIIGTLGGGAMTTTLRAGGLVEKLASSKQSEIEWKDIPFLRSLGYTPTEQSAMARTKAKWYNYKDELSTKDANYKALKSKNVPLTERIRNSADAYKFEQGADWKKLSIMRDAEKQIKKWETIKKRNEDDRELVKNANENILRIMQDAVNRMDELEK